MNVGSGTFGPQCGFIPSGKLILELYDKYEIQFIQREKVIKDTCQIFDRWGVKMYDMTSDKGQISWDGKNLGGKEVPAGTYFYLLKATGKDGVSFEKQGTVSLYK